MASEGPIGDRVKLPHQLWGPSTMVRWDSLTESFNPIFFLTKFLLPKFSFYFKVCFNYFFHWEFFGTTFFCEHIFLLLNIFFTKNFCCSKKIINLFWYLGPKYLGQYFFTNSFLCIQFFFGQIIFQIKFVWEGFFYQHVLHQQFFSTYFVLIMLICWSLKGEGGGAEISMFVKPRNQNQRLFQWFTCVHMEKTVTVTVWEHWYIWINNKNIINHIISYYSISSNVLSYYVIWY